MSFTAAIKKTLCLALLAALLVTSLSLPAVAAGYPKGSYIVNANNVYMRVNPYSGATPVAKLKKGTVVYYRSQSNGWYKVTWNTGKDTYYSGYVYRKYLTSVDNYSASAPSVTTSATYVTTANLRVRSSASINGAVIGKLKKGKKVTVIKQKKSWVYINYKGHYGWVSAKYLHKVG